MDRTGRWRRGPPSTSSSTSSPSAKWTGSTSRAAANLVAEGVLVQEGPGNYRFDNPIKKRWVIRYALLDAAIHLPATHPLELEPVRR
jgi:hypothetical protein